MRLQEARLQRGAAVHHQERQDRPPGDPQGIGTQEGQEKQGLNKRHERRVIAVILFGLTVATFDACAGRSSMLSRAPAWLAGAMSLEGYFRFRCGVLGPQFPLSLASA